MEHQCRQSGSRACLSNHWVSTVSLQKQNTKSNIYINMQGNILIWKGVTFKLRSEWQEGANTSRTASPQQGWGLPWWLSDQESGWQCRRHGFDLWSWKIPDATEQPIKCVTTIEPVPWYYWSLHAREPVLRNKRSHLNEKPMHCNERAAPAHHTRGKSKQQWRHSIAPKISKLKKKKEVGDEAGEVSRGPITRGLVY